jgi:hypothetical protein
VLAFLSSREHLLDQPLLEDWKCTIELKTTSKGIETTLTLTQDSDLEIVRRRVFTVATSPFWMNSETMLMELDILS